MNKPFKPGFYKYLCFYSKLTITSEQKISSFGGRFILIFQRNKEEEFGYFKNINQTLEKEIKISKYFQKISSFIFFCKLIFV